MKVIVIYVPCRGTHGYMAPEVLSKGTAYDSSADWFSFGCMLYKLLKGHSPFRQHKTKDKHEIDRMTLTMVSIPVKMLFISFRLVIQFKVSDKRNSCFFVQPLQNVELPESFSPELRSLLEGLLQRDVDKRLGCKGKG